MNMPAPKNNANLLANLLAKPSTAEGQLDGGSAQPLGAQSTNLAARLLAISSQGEERLTTEKVGIGQAAAN